MNTAKEIAVIGAGWAGCAAAVKLCSAGHKVTLFESARILGGRARALDIQNPPLDNGQHILLGAYAETLRLLKMVGIDADKALMRLPLQIRYPENNDGMNFIAARLPAPFHLLAAILRADGLTMADKMALMRFSTAARWMDWRLHTDCSVLELLDRFDQTTRLIQLMWQPLCVAALNTPPERASAQTFLNILRDSLGARRAASDMLLPRVDLTSLFPQQAAAYLEQNGSHARAGTTVQKIVAADARWSLETNGVSAKANQEFDAVVVATQATHASALLDHLIGNDQIPAFEYEPITTCYLQYSPEMKLAAPFYALRDNPDQTCWGQFVFDRGQLDARQAGLLAVVVSASTDALAAGQQTLAAAIGLQLAAAFGMPQLAQPAWTKIISEKRATFSCTPALQRPQEQTTLPHLVIAGDYLAGDYPATLESAIRSGVKAAQLLCEHFRAET